jgi:sporulation protein YlmC with PRC-barrel domain
MIRTSDLAGKPVRRENGERLGHVFEIRIENSRVVALICGSRGFFQRLTGSVSGRRIDWSAVEKVTASEIVVKRGPGKEIASSPAIPPPLDLNQKKSHNSGTPGTASR